MIGSAREVPLPVLPGSYVLVLALGRAVTLQVGKLGTTRFRRGFYAYAGSALGPGGIAARVGRHVRLNGTPHWHVDYLRRVAPACEAWFAIGRTRREHAWARALAGLSGAVTAIAGFGASDCRCTSHLVYFPAPPAVAAFRRAVRNGGSPIERTTFA